MEGREGDGLPSAGLSSAPVRDSSSSVTSSISSPFSSRWSSFDYSGCPPQSEYEEIPSRRWLTLLFGPTPPGNQTPDPLSSMELHPDRSSTQSSHQIVRVGGGAINEGNDDGEEDGGALGVESPAEDRCAGRLKDAAFVEEKVDDPTSGSSGSPRVFFLLVLSGLVGGRIVAMVLTVLWYSLVSPARSLWKSWKVHHVSVDALRGHGISL